MARAWGWPWFRCRMRVVLGLLIVWAVVDPGVARRAAALFYPGAADTAAKPSGRLRRLAGSVPRELLVHVLHFVPGRSLVAAAAGKDTAVLWSADSDDPLHVLAGHTGHIVDVQFFPQGDKLLTLGVDCRVLVWSVASGRQLRAIRGHDQETVFAVEVLPSGDRFLTVGGDFTAVLWDWARGEEVMRFRQEDEPAAHQAAKVLRGAARFVTGVSYVLGGSVLVWNASSGEVLHALRQPGFPVRRLEVSPGGDVVATGSDHRLWLWSALSGRVLHGPLGGHVGWITGVTFAHGGRKIVTCGNDRRVVVSDVGSGDQAMMRMDASVLGVVGAPWGQLVVPFQATSAVVWNTTSSSFLRSLEGPASFEQMAVSARGDLVAACSSGAGRSAVWLWRLSTGRLLRTWRSASALPTRHCGISFATSSVFD